jgi:hypothetical protein
MESNNRAWALSVDSRNAAQDREMLDAAHAAALHWAAVGTELNQMRAAMLLAEVHALLGYGTSAIAYAREVRDYFLSHDTPDWEIAFTHAIYSHAAHAVGDGAAHRESYVAAVAAIAAIVDEGDREVVANTFTHVPRP